MSKTGNLSSIFELLNQNFSTNEITEERVIIQEKIQINYGDSQSGCHEIPAQDFHSDYIGGNVFHEITDPDGRIKNIKEIRLVKSCIMGCVTTTDPKDTRYPYFAGRCYKGHDVCSNHLSFCDHPGCGKPICPLDGSEYKPGQYKCKRHHRIWLLKQLFKTFVSPFVDFPD